MQDSSLNLRRAQWIYRAFFVVYIVWASIHALLDAGAAEHGNSAGVSVHFIDALAGTEILAALVFLLPRLQIVGAVLLEFVFSIATFHEIVSHILPIPPVFYAGTVLFLTWLSREAALKGASTRAALQ